MSIQKLPPETRPRERLLLYGPDALSLAELIAIILGKGMKGVSALTLAESMLTHFGSLESLLSASIERLKQVKGIGEVKAIELKSVLELAKRLSVEVSPFPIYAPTQDAMKRVLKRYVKDSQKEHLLVACLNTRELITAVEVVAVGTLQEVLAHPREIFKAAIESGSAAIIVAHNHPSGDTTPSKQDEKMEYRLREIGKLLGIPIREFLIL